MIVTLPALKVGVLAQFAQLLKNVYVLASTLIEDLLLIFYLEPKF